MFDSFDSFIKATSGYSVDAEASRSSGHDAVHELMRAMILRTIEDFNSNERLRVKAIDYMNKVDDDDNYILSFQSICRHFGMDPGKTRHAIMHATRRLSTRRRTV